MRARSRSSASGESLATAEVAAEIATDNAGFVFATAGIHPHDAAAFDAARDIPSLRELLSHSAVAVGECGLDYHYDNSPRDAQRAAFSAQIALADEMNKPVVVHTRDAEDDTRSIIREARTAGVLGVMHCYTGSHSLAEFALDAGWYVSFSGIVTFNKWTDDDLVRLVPRDRLLVESDSPISRPFPSGGNGTSRRGLLIRFRRWPQPAGDDPLELGRATAANAERLFGLALDAH